MRDARQRGRRPTRREQAPAPRRRRAIDAVHTLVHCDPRGPEAPVDLTPSQAEAERVLAREDSFMRSGEVEKLAIHRRSLPRPCDTQTGVVQPPFRWFYDAGSI